MTIHVYRLPNAPLNMRAIDLNVSQDLVKSMPEGTNGKFWYLAVSEDECKRVLSGGLSPYVLVEDMYPKSERLFILLDISSYFHYLFYNEKETSKGSDFLFFTEDARELDILSKYTEKDSIVSKGKQYSLGQFSISYSADGNTITLRHYSDIVNILKQSTYPTEEQCRNIFLDSPYEQPIETIYTGQPGLVL